MSIKETELEIYEFVQGQNFSESQKKAVIDFVFAQLEKFGASQAQQTTAELPKAAAWHCRSGGEDRYAKKLDTPGMHQTESKPLYTATQMQAHYQAGVRAGMGQSQDAKRYRWLRDHSDRVFLKDGPDDYGWIPSNGDDIDAACDAAMQGGQQ